MSGSDDERDLAAAEYVLGTLDAASARALARAAETDPALAGAIAAWERRLAPLARLVPPVAPPADLWPRIAAATPTATPMTSGRPLARAWQSVRFWRVSTAGALALAAVLAGLIVLRPSQHPMYMASLTPMRSHTPMFVAEMRPGGPLMVHALSPVTVAEGKALELWAKQARSGAMIPLGVVPASGRRVRMIADLGAGTELMISLEPAGASPSGASDRAPRGPMLYEGRLVRID
ncbi:MAG TPA: anti-sigma factor [Acetobacteraceae bacterium]|jgi:anti-sigma-K factor RskA|nr:anti-sigma factor [Acetobacteraceae bacterium]